MKKLYYGGCLIVSKHNGIAPMAFIVYGDTLEEATTDAYATAEAKYARADGYKHESLIITEVPELLLQDFLTQRATGEKA